jgi:hypothetical protein
VIRVSRSSLDEFQRLPAALLVDLPLFVPLFAVSRLTLSETYSLAPVGASAYRTATTASTDTLSVTALLIGPQRLLWQKDLELLATSSRRGGSLGAWTSGALSGLVFVSRLVTRTSMQITDLSFTASSQRLETTEVSVSLRHVPRAGPVDALVGLGTTAAMSAVEFLT